MMDKLSISRKVDSKDCKDCKDYVKKNGVSGVKKFCIERLEKWKNVEIHFAITGDAGSGKSSFINAIRG